MISFEEFKKLAASYNVIPLTRSILADLQTPVSIYLTLRADRSASFLFESVEPDETIGRRSFVGAGPEFILKAQGDEVVTISASGTRSGTGSMFDVVAESLSTYRCAPLLDVDGFVGGYAGYIGYDCVRHIERVTLPPPSPLSEPDALLGFFRSVAVYDHRCQKITLIRNVFIDPTLSLRQQYDDGVKRLEALELRLRASLVHRDNFQHRTNGHAAAHEKDQFCKAVSQAKRYIHEGDIFQTVLSRRTQVGYTGDPFAVYRALRVMNPSPYLFFVDFGETKLIGSSPEVLVRSRGGVAETFPIAGTRKRGVTEEEDCQRESELLSDEKESAEHVMLVDLGRNDLGRFCEYGSVTVPVFKRVQRYSHVMHLVSQVRGNVSDGMSAVDVLKACFPAGTVSGAPKIRAMEIISELEKQRRGVYAGAVGYLGLDGSLDTCIAIRTIVAHRDTLSVQSGAGIVADSSPEKEFQETVDKAQVLMEAINHAGNGMIHLMEKETAGIS